ncbi:MAG: hypothetical protein ACWGSQ_06930 [Longimicrobiales bacterium]
MNHRIKLTLLACLVSPSFAAGQEMADPSFARYGFTLGVSVYQARDEVLNNLRHRGPSIMAGVFWEGMSNAAMHRMEVSFAFAPLTDRYSPDRSSLLFQPAIELRYARKAVRISEDYSLFLGGTVGWNSRFSFYENWDQAHAYWLTSSHLGLAASLVRPLDNGNAFQLDLDAPLLAVVSRPPSRFEYKEVRPDLGWVFREIHSDPRVTSIHEHTAVTATLSYLRPGGGFFGQRLFWQTAFTSSRLPSSRPFTSLSHTLGISHSF